MTVDSKHIKSINNAYSKKYKYLIKWNAKCGCTLYRRFFLELHKDEGYVNEEWEKGLPSFRYNINLKPEIINSFLLTRNPYKRVVSMYTNKYMGPLKNDNLRNKFILKENSFYFFVLKLKEFKDNNSWCDIHLTPQYYNYEENDILIKLENFNIRTKNLYETIPHLQNLKQKVNNFCNNDLGYINKTENKNNSTIFIGYNKYDNNYNGPWPDYKYFYDEKIKNLVYEIYKKDFELFHYKKDSI
jgi:hypothetical protein